MHLTDLTEQLNMKLILYLLLNVQQYDTRIFLRLFSMSLPSSGKLHHKNCAFIVCKFLQFIDLINFLGYFKIYNLTLNSHECSAANTRFYRLFNFVKR
ncbi:hypothetical protein T07_9110 [Trichinella nelsoni]|uniref:Uncharacterized protein n=1 Tax=Trichinella nelsoni TaxID=6336 RepID=A0A0V0SLX9_9BILA|nr:hypothetical protein T07_9110 [Trichinella nelsoni]